MKKVCFFVTVILVYAGFQALPAQDSLRNESGQSLIKLEAFVGKTESPLNRPLNLTIRLTWQGDLDRFEVHPFDNPILQNLEIVGNASSNRVGAQNGVTTSVQDFEFTLKPTSLGMAYIEGLIIPYTDLATDKEYKLTTNRIEVKVIDPIPEPGSKAWLIWVVFWLVLASIICYAVLVIKNKKQERRKQAELDAEAAIPMEEKFLSELKSSVDFKSPGLETGNSITKISKLLRLFLHEKFNVSGLEATTSEVLSELEGLQLDDRFINETTEVLTKADMIKFTGGHSEKSELERFYTLVESNLRRSLRGELQAKSEPEQMEE